QQSECANDQGQGSGFRNGAHLLPAHIIEADVLESSCSCEVVPVVVSPLAVNSMENGVQVEEVLVVETVKVWLVAPADAKNGDLWSAPSRSIRPEIERQHILRAER